MEKTQVEIVHFSFPTGTVVGCPNGDWGTVVGACQECPKDNPLVPVVMGSNTTGKRVLLPEKFLHRMSAKPWGTPGSLGILRGLIADEFNLQFVKKTFSGYWYVININNAFCYSYSITWQTYYSLYIICFIITRIFKYRYSSSNRF